MSRSLAAMTNQHWAIQARLDLLTTALNPPQNNQPSAPPVAPANIQHQPPPPIPLANNQPPSHISPPQDPLATWLHWKNNPPCQYHNPLYDSAPSHVGYDAHNMGQYAESVVELAKENNAIIMLKEYIKTLN